MNKKRSIPLMKPFLC